MICSEMRSAETAEARAFECEGSPGSPEGWGEGTSPLPGGSIPGHADSTDSTTDAVQLAACSPPLHLYAAALAHFCAYIHLSRHLARQSLKGSCRAHKQAHEHAVGVSLNLTGTGHLRTLLASAVTATASGEACLVWGDNAFSTASGLGSMLRVLHSVPTASGCEPRQQRTLAPPRAKTVADLTPHLSAWRSKDMCSSTRRLRWRSPSSCDAGVQWTHIFQSRRACGTRAREATPVSSCRTAAG